ncbi:MAG TPA: DNA translocase FtsK [Clostridia bacterium]|nr:DNA translocase FtsK [Clostridia bacterium]
MPKLGFYFKAMPKRKKLVFLRLIILIAITVLLIVKVTNAALLGVFGYMSYGYLAIGYVFFIADLVKKGKWKTVATRRTALVVSAFLSIVLTIHIAFLKEAINKGFSEYIAAVYNVPSFGGVILSLISSPIVLPCKYIISTIIFFSLSVVLCFFVLAPYIFVNNKKKKEKLSLIQTDSAKENKEEIGKEALLSRLKGKPAQEKISIPDPKEEAGKKLFGAEYSRPIPNVPKQEELLPPTLLNPKETRSDYYIADDIEAIKLKPNSSLYSNNYLSRNEEKLRKDAANKLGLGSDEFYRSLYNTEEETTIKEDIKPTLQMNDYTPCEVLYDDTPSDENDSDIADTFDFEGGFEEEVVVEDEELMIEEEKQETAYIVPPVKKEVRKRVVKEIAEQEKLTLQRPYHYPSKEILIDHSTKAKGFVPYVDNFDELKDVIEVKLKNYNIDATFIDAIKGPTITRCIVDLDDKCPISKVISAKPDINRLLMTTQEITILPQMDDSPYFGIEVPNKVRGIVSFKEIISSREYAEAKGDILIALGKTAEGRIMIEDLAEMPHALIAGATGSGKSVCISVVLASILYRYSPAEVKLMLIDLKRVEMELFAGLPHMLVEKPLDDVNEIMNALKWLREETERRYIAFRGVHAKKLSEYNNIVGKDNQLPRIVVIIDEASELMTNPLVRKPVESSLSSLARIARAAGVHLIFATQNPVKEVITNEIQNNLNTKIAFAVGDYNHSMVIFKAKGAESLLGNGDMYIKRGKDMVRGQCAFISTEEVEGIVEDIKANNDIDFDYDAIERILHGSKEELQTYSNSNGMLINQNQEDDERIDAKSDAKEELLKESLRICVESGRASCSLVQRKLQKGYNTIANVMDYMESKGWVSEQVNNKRTLLITKEEFYQMYPDLLEDK